MLRDVVETAVRRSAAERWRTLAGRLSSAALIGFLTGAIVGGLGGRIAMLVLRLTSDPSVRGMESDDGFTIGVVSGATAFLVMATAFLGVVGALVYLAIRPWLPPRLRPWTSGLVAGVVGGAVVIRPDGIDFTLLSPISLAVAMFIALPAAYGFVLAVLVERSLRRPAGRRWRSFVGLALLVPVLPLPVALGLRSTVVFGVIVAVLVGLWFLSRRAGLAAAWTSPLVTWLGRTVVAVLTALAGMALIRDVLAVL
jgi:hypothetical protein